MCDLVGLEWDQSNLLCVTPIPHPFNGIVFFHNTDFLNYDD